MTAEEGVALLQKVLPDTKIEKLKFNFSETFLDFIKYTIMHIIARKLINKGFSCKHSSSCINKKDGVEYCFACDKYKVYMFSFHGYSKIEFIRENGVTERTDRIDINDSDFFLYEYDKFDTNLNRFIEGFW